MMNKLGKKLCQQLRVYLNCDDFIAEGSRLFGENLWVWKFECPACGNVHAISSEFNNPHEGLEHINYCVRCDHHLFTSVGQPPPFFKKHKAVLFDQFGGLTPCFDFYRGDENEEA